MKIEILLFAVHSDIDHYNQPHIFQTGRTASFFNACFGTSINQVVLHLKGYSIVSVQGMAKTHLQEVLELKKKTSELILKKSEAAALLKISWMYYVNFDDNITSKYCVVCKNWLLSKFCCPGDISSLNELCVLFHAFMTNATKFLKLSDMKFEHWMEQHFQQALTQSSRSMNDNNDNLNPNSNTTDANSNDTSSNDANSNEEGLGPEERNMLVAHSTTASEGSRTEEAQPHNRRKLKTPPSIQFINSVFTSGRIAMAVLKKPHTTRKDKGVP
ncbi:hypothetical protein BDR05DRAFT_949745 [Suillus weaverae]|nr:hypothetical protein BDR05DRAFT_949745 [Suillus weaverae]